MRHAVRNIEEKRPIAFTLDKIHCMFRIPGSKHPLLPRADILNFYLTVMPELKVKLVEMTNLRMMSPHIV
jgi:hypothetical protein